MAQRIDVPGLYADALKALPETIGGQPPLPASGGLPGYLQSAQRRRPASDHK
jgi:hypothetical protein